MMGENEDATRTTLGEMMMKCVFVVGFLVGKPCNGLDALPFRCCFSRRLKVKSNR